VKAMVSIAGALAATLGVLSASFVADQLSVKIELTPRGLPRPVLQVSQQVCGPNDLPDAGLRAFRRDYGIVVAFANGPDNFPLTRSRYR
jgi:hypothetical protein